MKRPVPLAAPLFTPFSSARWPMFSASAGLDCSPRSDGEIIERS